MGFKDNFINWIHVCILSPFTTLVNDHPSNTFGTSRGLRQGDPLSPVLFVIPMEWLTTLFEYAEVEGKIKALGKKDYAVSHLFFADEVMIFSRASVHFVKWIEDVLISFSKTSGLQPNLVKSKIIFLQGCPCSYEILFQLRRGIIVGKIPGSAVALQKIAYLTPVIGKVKKLGFYGLNTLSQAGRVELIKYVVIPRSGSRCSNFLQPSSNSWSNQCVISFGKVMPTNPPWSRSLGELCQPKRNGGLNLLSLMAWNDAAIMKLIGDIFGNNKSLWENWMSQNKLNGKSFREMEGKQQDPPIGVAFWS